MRQTILALLMALAFTPAVRAADGVPAPVVLADAGFVLPAGMTYDAENDRYLVSNIGAGNANDGFISIVGVDGKLQQLKWISGGVNGVELEDPKGMVARNGVLYVADLKAIRRFDLKTGAQLASTPIDGVIALDDLAIAADGTIFVTDGGVARSTVGGVYRIDPDGKVNVLEQGEKSFNPRGIAIASDGVVLNSTGSAGYIIARTPNGDNVGVLTLDKSLLDGLLFLPNGDILVASWTGHDITSIDVNGNQKVLFDNIDTPAGIGFDTKRNLLLVPQIIENEVRILPMPKAG